MKKFYCLFVLLATMSAAFAADSYLPILKEGRNWRYYVYSLWEDSDVGYATFLAHGHKEVDGKVYTKIFSFYKLESDPDMIVTDENDYSLLVREEEGKIYWKSDVVYPGISELLVMDMSLTDADSVPIILLEEKIQGSYFVDSIWCEHPVQADTINVGGIDRKRLLGWIEGVGTNDTDNHLFVEWVIKPSYYREVFLGCYDGDELVCGPEAFGMAGIEQLTPDSPAQDAPTEYYNLQGIRVTEPAARGIYIRRQGSKVSKIKF